MCGIAGILNFDQISSQTEQTVCRMMQIIRHRGPDESGLYSDSDVCLGQTRLSILGLECGIQPMSNQDKSLWIVYNGEAFNYLERQEELIKKGYRFETGTDTEVVLALYQEYGSDCLSMLNGQFAFAIWDVIKRELFLTRDRVGIRPLYYVQRPGGIAFASEIKALFADSRINRTIDSEALSQIFTFWTTITPKTAFKEVYELPPGHFLKVTTSGVNEPQAYWNIPFAPLAERWQGSFEDAKFELSNLLTDAIRLRLRADVPVGAYLSGGLDSSIITSLISSKFDNHLRTFSLAFQENSFDESTYQKRLVTQLGTEHSEIKVANQDIRANLPNVIWFCEKPLLRTGPVPLFSLSRLVRDNGFKVVLTGEGADEIFGGYNIFKEAKIRHFWSREPSSNWRPLLVQKLYPYIFKDPARGRMFLQQFFSVKSGDLEDPFFSHQIRWRNSGKNRSFFSQNTQNALQDYDPFLDLHRRLPENYMELEPFSKAQFLEMDVFLLNYLLSSQGDRVGMGNSIELRLPFLDYRVIEFAAKLPAHWKIKGLNEKYILKEAFKSILPESISRRTKQPYRAPIKEAFWTDEPGSYVEDLLSEENIRKYDHFDAKKVALLARRFQKDATQAASEVQNMALVGILSTQLLHRQFVEEFTPDSIEPIVPDRMISR